MFDIVSVVDRTIREIYLDESLKDDERGALVIVLGSGHRFEIYDGHGQSCCEHRYLETSDDLSALVGEQLVSVVCEYHDNGSEWGEDQTEAASIHIRSDRDSVVVGCYNSNNGYYGGLSPVVDVIDSNGIAIVTGADLQHPG